MINKKPKLPPKGTVVQFQMNPEFDETFVFINLEIPTSNKGYSELSVELNESINKLFPEVDYMLYKKNIKPMGKVFMEEVKKRLLKNKKTHWPYKKSLAIAVEINGSKSKYGKRDIDNVLKMVFDAFKGIIFDDDDQIVMVLSRKVIWGFDLHGFTVAIRELEYENDNFIYPQLFTSEYKSEWDNDRAKELKPNSVVVYNSID